MSSRSAAAPPSLPARPRPLTRDELIAFGEAWGQTVSAPAVIAISGDLGAGKTTLVQAMCRGYGVPEPVTSPTFALVHEYAASKSPVYHLDLYRLRDERDLTNIGWDEIVSSHALVLVEWPDRAGSRLPTDAIQVTLAHVAEAPDVRSVRVE